MQWSPWLIVVTSSILMNGQLHAAEIVSFELRKTNNRYVVNVETDLAAPTELVFSVLLDYDSFHHLSEGISESRWLPESVDDFPLAYTRIDSCVAFFCRRVEKVEQVKVLSSSEIETIVLPERSNFLYSRTNWRLARSASGTRIHYQLEMQPDFWVPPVIGPWAIKRKARSSALKVARRMEFLAWSGIALADFDLNDDRLADFRSAKSDSPPGRPAH